MSLEEGDTNPSLSSSGVLSSSTVSISFWWEESEVVESKAVESEAVEQEYGLCRGASTRSFHSL